MTNTPATESANTQAASAPPATPTAPARKKATAPSTTSQRAAPKKAAPRPTKSNKTATSKAPAKAKQANPVRKDAPKAASKSANQATSPASKVKTTAPAKPAVNKPTASPAKPSKDKKVKVVRDSFTIPKNELLQIGESKKRALGLGVEIKKSELIRAGLQALTSMNDAAFKKALAGVPTIKTGRPAKS